MDSTVNFVLPAFGGQESVTFDPNQASNLFSLCESNLELGLLLESCHSAFLSELASLSSELGQDLHICAQDFQLKDSVLNPKRESYLNNPVISGTTLVLRQALQYLAYLHGRKDEDKPQDLANSDELSATNVLGFSSGMLCAAAVASSASRLSFINHALEAYRLAFWIGARVYKRRLELGSSPYDMRSWAIVLFNTREDDVAERIYSFSQGTSRVQLTAQIDDSTFTVSGHPDDLAEFTQILPSSISTSETSINALYHSPHHLDKAAEQVISDVSCRHIRFPSYTDLIRPLRSCSTGEVIKPSPTTSLVETIIRMTLTEPVRWDQVIGRTCRDISEEARVQILNFGLRRSMLQKLDASISQDSRRVTSSHTMDPESSVASKPQAPIAIVGMALNVPKAADADALWELLRDGICTAEDASIPLERFDCSDYRLGRTPGRELKVSKANFVADVAEFDHKFFNISPREAESMDPQQRLLLRVGHHALEDAGYVPDATESFASDTFGCFIGAATSDYRHNLKDNIDVYYSPGTLSAFLSGRLSYHLGISGPSMVIDTACSSSLVAIHQAARALASRDCNAALAGGVNVISSPDMFIGLDRAHFLSTSGQCKPFDASADGYGRAEGCCIFVLKRLQDALRENDRIHGVIRGIEINQSGRSESITRPHGPTQQDLFKKLLARTYTRPIDVAYVEAHGTGTQAGDVIEMESIRAALAIDRQPPEHLHIGSIKANLGHLEAASGAVSLAKVLLMMRQQSIPPQISLVRLNEKIAPLETDGCRINTRKVVDWTTSRSKRRIAVVNNFGASGSNAAALIQEYDSPKTNSTVLSSYVFGISAKDGDALERARSNVIRWLKCHPDASLADASYTLMARRTSYAHRLSVSASTIPELISGFTHATPSWMDPKGRPVVFVFSGQGSHYFGMGSELYDSSPAFRELIDACNNILLTSGFNAILPFVTGKFDVALDLDTIEASQTAVFSLQYALARLWMSWGVNPTALVGHSLGEYAALVIADCLSLRDALFVVATRARLMARECGLRTSAMLAVPSSANGVQTILSSSTRWTKINISCVNSPEHCIVSGSSSDLSAFKTEIEATMTVRTTLLDVPFAFHSPAMAPILTELREHCKKVSIKSPRFPIASALFGRVIAPGDQSFAEIDYFARHCIDPVRFAHAVNAIPHSTVAGGTAAWLEIGPHPTLLPMLKSFPHLSGSSFLPSLHKRENSWTTLAKTLSTLFLVHAVNWRAVFDQIGPTAMVNLPAYPFAKETFWIPFREAESTHGQPRLEFAFMRSCSRLPCVNKGVAIFETSSLDFDAFLQGHRVGGVALCPASVYIEIAAAATLMTLESRPQRSISTTLSFSDIVFDRPFIFEESQLQGGARFRIEVNTPDGLVAITSSSGSQQTTPHTTGHFRLHQNQELYHTLQDEFDLEYSRMQSIKDTLADTYSSRTIYDVIFPRVVDYSEQFRTVRQLSLSADSLEAIATVTLNSDSHPQAGPFVVHPLFVDTLIHVPGFVANLHGGQTYAYICSSISSITFIPASFDVDATYTVFAVCKPVSDGMECNSYAIREGTERVLVARLDGIRFQKVRLSALRTALGLEGTDRTFDLVSAPVDSFDPGSLPATPSAETLLGSPISLVKESPIRRLVADVLQINLTSIRDHDRLGDLGLDSLSSIELAHLFRKQYHSDLPRHLVGPDRTVKELEAACDPHSKPNNAATAFEQSLRASPDLRLLEAEDGLQIIQASTSAKTPLILIHDGSGFIDSYRRLSDLRRPVYGISGLAMGASQQSVVQIALLYAGIVAKKGFSAVILSGWSFGGIVAFEMAKILQNYGITIVSGIILVDVPAPSCHPSLSSNLLDEMLSNSHIPLNLRPLCKTQFSRSNLLLDKHELSSNGFKNAPPPIAFLESMDGYQSSSGLDVPQWLADRSETSSIAGCWDALTGMPVKKVDIPGNHFQAFDPRMVGRVSECMKEACGLFDQQ